VPDGDLFKSIKSGKASVVTDEIETFTETGIRLRSGVELEADIIITATGLNLLALGGIEISVDGKAIDPAKTLNYKGTMFSGVPNLAAVFGYTNASWTLKAELTCQYVCRLINHMDKKGYKICLPQNDDPTMTEEPWLNLSSGYIQRAADQLPKQGSKMPVSVCASYFDTLHVPAAIDSAGFPLVPSDQVPVPVLASKVPVMVISPCTSGG
jgi:monooxygenase